LLALVLDGVADSGTIKGLRWEVGLSPGILDHPGKHKEILSPKKKGEKKNFFLFPFPEGLS
jgi:hypothetical protein